jgi:hypothetical protein
MPESGSDKSLPTLATELWDLVRAYAKQETVEPLKGLGRSVGFGVAGAFCLGIGVVLLVVGVLRVLQTETGEAFDGNWSWVPYLIVLVLCGVVVGLALKGTSKRKRKAAAR